jgi:hypothetical protein
MVIELVHEKNANFCRRKLAKIAENWDHNIGPGSCACVLSISENSGSMFWSAISTNKLAILLKANFMII